MRYLKEHRLDEVIKSLRQPVLGICIGQQLMCRHSEESDTECLGIFDAEVKRFVPTERNEKVPHMGWNDLSGVQSDLFKGVRDGEFVYFVHSFYVPCSEHTIATCNYTLPFSAALHKDNFYAAQFHPEKSGAVGERILQNFLNIEL
jgi:glutamine amidotransferase